MHEFSAIILAAGRGKRYGKQKQFELLNCKEVWRWSYETIMPEVAEVFVVGIDFVGGKTRMESVKIGLNHVKTKYVLIHDASRPLVKASDISSIKRALMLGSKSVSLCMPVSNTIVCKDRQVHYLDRNKLSAIATPQGFVTDILKSAYNKNTHEELSDDCSVVQKNLGIDPYLIESGLHLHKLTYPEDLKFLEAIC